MTKLEAATHQLSVAIQLFYSGDYLSSLTLAGAAEEILGKLSQRAGKPVAVDEITQFHADDIDAAIPENQRKTVLLGVLNRGRNQAKHANDPEETHIVFDHTEPLQMIMRALPMAFNLDESMLVHKPKLDAWIQAHPDAFD
ncbi:hypothetical protein [Duganella violaceipulchra]|uniref:DUF4145 domain-containing protein n=1 Tax=Duganella violaceipulchra TaxID=2849652 RepID=A0AA41H5W5_9BURK|nr:hypothetical protein [Duganella violaceicalia]MBV6320071.1 hypothetical protein [Duganella violaceicalia]MCP2010437.1 hypothetical protein [Duganella violaceicalia]